jgi:transcriptional regulator with XRE-family HTH domain
MNYIGENIKKFRKLRGMSQDELASLVVDEKNNPLSRVTITRYENEREPSIHILRKIAKALKVSIVELLSEDTYEAEESLMIELLLEKTLNGTIEWEVLNQISIDDSSRSVDKFNKIMKVLDSLPITISFLDLRTNDSFYCNFNGIDYLLITYLQGRRELLIDTHEKDKILVFEENTDGILDRLAEVSKNSKPATYRRGISKILESLSGTSKID